VRELSFVDELELVDERELGHARAATPARLVPLVTVATKLLAYGAHNAASGRDVYTVPQGHTAILKDMRLVTYASPAPEVQVFSADTSGRQITLWWQKLVQYEPAHWEGWVVLPPGFVLRVGLNQDLAVLFWFSGTELIGVPDTPTVPTLLELGGTLPA